jgi:hypothetical protein
MSFSLGILSITLLFLYIIIPGYITRRFYYHGEFSKQINISSNPIVHIVYSSIVGIIVTFIFISLLNCTSSIPINIDNEISNFKVNYLSELSANITNTSPNEKDNKSIESNVSDKKEIIGNEKFYTIYLPFLFFLYLISSVIGYFLSKIVIFYKLDTKYKFLRFNNDWHYVFNGKIFQFKKHSIPDVNPNLEIKYTYLNVLIQNEIGENTLYSGFLADYDLSPIVSNKIERLHLLKASKNIKDMNGNIIQKNIPGNLFTLIGDKILNVNCVYICYDADEIEEKKNNTKAKWYKYKSNFLFSYQIFLLMFFIIISVFILFKFNLINNEWYNSICQKSKLFRVLLLFTFNVFMGLLNPFKNDFKNKKIEFLGWDKIFLKVMLITFLISVLLFVPI